MLGGVIITTGLVMLLLQVGMYLVVPPMVAAIVFFGIAFLRGINP